MARIDELRLITKVARMYYEQELRQPEIMKRLNLSQSTISRLLSRARESGIVRITVNVPSGTHPDLEEVLQERYALKQCVVVECVDDEEQIIRELGEAAAFFVETTASPSDVSGISSWSAALLAMVDAMHHSVRGGARVLQILGGIGSPGAEVHATQLTRRLAHLLNGEATLLPAPGVVGSRKAREVLLEDRFVAEATRLFDRVTLALVGIGAVEPSRLLAESGNVFSKSELNTLGRHGAVGDICLHFFNEQGHPVVSPLHDRVIGMTLEQLRRVDRVVGVAGGKRKTLAIKGALAGGWINILITDRNTAERLLKGA